jgi:U3 small nucleolar RNA-associated protein 13
MFAAHSDTVLSIDAIDDLLISSSKDKTIKLWKLKEKDSSYQLIGTFTGHLESVGCVALAPKTTSFFISGSVDKSIKVWSLKQAMKTFQKQKKILPKKKEALEISNALRSIYAHEKDINAVKFAPNEKIFASASQDRTIKVIYLKLYVLIIFFKIWDSSTFSAKLILRGHKRGVWDIAFSPMEKLLVSSSGDSTLKIWNLVDGSCLNSLEGHNGSVLKVNWICYGLEIVSGNTFIRP